MLGGVGSSLPQEERLIAIANKAKIKRLYLICIRMFFIDCDCKIEKKIFFPNICVVGMFRDGCQHSETFSFYWFLFSHQQQISVKPIAL
jgi:hypothetical protein